MPRDLSVSGSVSHLFMNGDDVRELPFLWYGTMLE